MDRPFSLSCIIRLSVQGAIFTKSVHRPLVRDSDSTMIDNHIISQVAVLTRSWRTRLLMHTNNGKVRKA